MKNSIDAQRQVIGGILLDESVLPQVLSTGISPKDFAPTYEIIFDYIPEKGTIITVKGIEKGIIPGEDFMQAIFSIYIGSNPASEQLKQGLLK